MQSNIIENRCHLSKQAHGRNARLNCVHINARNLAKAGEL